jgi:hypothetical protein
VKLAYPFTEEEFNVAAREWGCNCGPSALAFATQKRLDAVRHAIPGFAEKRYTSPLMMKAALEFLRTPFVAVTVREKRHPADVEGMFAGTPTLVRVQWTGPWTAPGANPKWAYRQTHWIVAWHGNVEGAPMVFDCNGGVRGFSSWEDEIVPLILQACVPRADGGWYPTHIWRLCGGGA